MSRVRWYTQGRAVAAAVATTVAITVAVTGCAAGAKLQAGPSGGPARPAATGATMAVPRPGPQAASTGDPNGVLLPAPAPPSPRCPPLVRYAAGNAGPLFCTDGRDNPAALRYFTGLHLKVMGLAATASQSQAVSVICADLQHAAVGTEYSAYLLAATREQWTFAGIAKVHGALSSLCPKR